MRALKRFYEIQAAKLRVFMRFAPETVRCVQVDEDKQELLFRLLAGLDAEADNPHTLLVFDTGYAGEEPYFSSLRRELIDRVEPWRSDLEALDVALPPGVAPSAESATKTRAIDHFVEYAEALAESLPGEVGSLVLILVPDGIGDPGGYLESIVHLAEHSRTPRLRYIVVDSRDRPLLGTIEQQTSRAHVQVFHVEPAEIETGLKEELAAARTTLTSAERRSYLAMLASFAYARKDYDRAKDLQMEQLGLMDEAEELPLMEAATGLFHLGNTCMARGETIEAEAALTDAANLCIQAGDRNLIPMVLTNLGSCLARQHRFENADAAFDAARSYAKANQHPPTEAHVLDSWAQALDEAGMGAEAEGRWLEAVRVYDGITSPTFESVRIAGRSDLTQKLRAYYERTGQQAKAVTLGGD